MTKAEDIIARYHNTLRRPLEVKKPVWIEERDVITLYARLLALHGGAPGLGAAALLQSALARPRQHFAYALKPGVIGMAAFYTAGIVQNHAFLDGTSAPASCRESSF